MKNWKGDKKSIGHQLLIIALLIGVWSCGRHKVDPLPSYLDENNLKGSGLINVEGALTLRAEGAERLDASTKTYSGLVGTITSSNVLAQFTSGQPVPFSERRQIPIEYQSYGELRIIGTTDPGTYRMGIVETPGPRGEIADLTLSLPGPQLYFAQTGSLTINQSTLFKTQGATKLYHVTGTFQTIMNGSGIGTVPGEEVPVTGIFDLLLPSI